jgi:hypothetical protein
MKTLTQLQDTTALLPGLIAGIVSGDDPAFVEWAETRTLYLYNHNGQFRRMLHRQDSRERLYAFIGHWWEAWKLRGGKPKPAWRQTV